MAMKGIGGRWLLPISILLAALAAAPLAAMPQGEAAKPDPTDKSRSLRERLDLLVERIKLEQSLVETMEAEFEQEKVSALFVEPETSTGVFTYRAPEQIRWEYLTPDPIVMLIDDTKMLTWYKDLGRAETVTVKRYADQVFKYLGAGGSLESMMKYFFLTVNFPGESGGPYRLLLDPRFSRISRRVESIELWVDEKTFLPIRLKYVEANGDYTDYRFKDMKINLGLPEGQFEVDLPPDVVVERVSRGNSSAP